MSEALKNALITIESYEEQAKGRFALKTDRGTFSFFKTKVDGGETVAYQYWKENELGTGSTVGVAYEESKGEKAVFKSIRFFIPADDIQMHEENLPERQVEEKPSAPAKPDWDAIAKGKVRHGLVCALIQAGKTSEEIKNLLPFYVNIVMDEPEEDEIPF